ncbi:hypothetical protein CLOP_g12793 [Closterium sp. NIES-67]|nr:hypothetical protein CLOP_g12793 [Closterium sp. NIES-67]
MGSETDTTRREGGVRTPRFLRWLRGRRAGRGRDREDESSSDEWQGTCPSSPLNMHALYVRRAGPPRPRATAGERTEREREREERGKERETKQEERGMDQGEEQEHQQEGER